MPAKKETSAKKAVAKKQPVARKTGAKKAAQPAIPTRDVPGTLLRGADGNLYFVPDSVLEPFRVFDSERANAEKRFESPETGATAASQPASNLEAVHTTITVAESTTEQQPPVGLLFAAYFAEAH